jgi:hypothetical protein
VPVRRSGRPPKPGQAGSSSKSSSSTAAAPSSISDFPSLAATTSASSRGVGKAAAASSSSRGGGKAGLSSSSRAAPQPVQTVAEAVAAAGGVSEQLKAANKALVERCKAALSDEGFKAFREQSAGFMQGALGAGGCASKVSYVSTRAVLSGHEWVRAPLIQTWLPIMSRCCHCIEN